MSDSDKIQLTIAVVAGISSLLAAISIILNYLQIKSQKKQWQSQFIPYFKILYFNENLNEAFFVIEEINNVPYKLLEFSFTNPLISTDIITNGSVVIRNQKRGEREEYKGFMITLKPLSQGVIPGQIHLVVEDSIGIVHQFKSTYIKFIDKEIHNEFEIGNTHFYK